MKKIIYSILLISFSFTTGALAQTLKDAIRLTDNEQYEDAGVMLKNLIGQEPLNLTYYYYLGENYLLSDNADSALMIFKKAERVDANNPLIKIGLAKCNLDKYSVREMKALSELEAQNAAKAKSNYEKLANKTAADQLRMNESQVKAGQAEAQYREALGLVNAGKVLIRSALEAAGPKNVRAYIEAADALIHFKNKDLDTAKVYLNKASALQPENDEILILYGDIYSELNNGSLAADYYNRALDKNPQSAKSIVSKGRLYRRSTNYEGAADEFKNAIKIENNYAPAHRELGDVYFKLNKLDSAKEEYRKYLELSKNNCDARSRYAYFLYVSRDYAGALGELRQMKNCDPNNITALRIQAFSFYETKDSTNAISAIQNLFSKIREDRIAGIDYEYYGKILIMNNNDSLAVEYLRKAYLLDKSRCDLLNEIWKSYDKTKNYAEAANVMQEKIQNCKGATVTDYFNLGRSYFFNRDFPNADIAFAKVNELTPKYASGFLWRAEANSYIDSASVLGLAKPHYEKYIEVAVADTAGMSIGKYKNGLIEAYHYLYAYYYLQAHDVEKAKEYLSKRLTIDPDDKDAQDALKGIEFEQQKKKKP